MKSVQHADVARIARELRDRRLYLGLSQETIGGQLNVSGQQVGSWERGDVMPQIGTVCRWAEALDLKIRFDMRPPI